MVVGTDFGIRLRKPMETHLILVDRGLRYVIINQKACVNFTIPFWDGEGCYFGSICG